MSEISSYVKLSPKETVIDNWEVVNDAGTPTVGEIVPSVIAGIVVYYAILLVFRLVFDFPAFREAMYRDEYSYLERESEARATAEAGYTKGPTGDLEPARSPDDVARDEEWRDEERAREEAERQRRFDEQAAAR